MKYLRVGINGLIVAFLALMADSCVHCDPYVRLPNGYCILAASESDPCSLVYEPWNDERSHSAWRALCWVDKNEEGEESEVYVLVNEATNEMLEFDSASSWEAERRARNAEPSTIDAQEFSGITGFRRHDPYVIGEYDGGYFILNTAEDSINSFTTRPEWVRAVGAAGMPTDHLVDPKSWLVQTRHPVFYGVMGGLVLITLPWVFRPLWAGRRAATTRTRSSDPTPDGSESDSS